MATVTVTVDAPPPFAAVDSASTVTGTPVTVEVLLNDSGIGITITSVSSPSNGTAEIAGGMSVVYTPDASFVHTDSFTYTITDVASATASATVTVTTSGGEVIPPDPSTTAPPLDRSVVTDLSTATDFLYSGPDAVQTDMAPGIIDAEHVVVLRGRVITRDREPLPGVAISILARPEFGTTLSRADGAFDLVVNGGGVLVIDYQKEDYLPAQRKVDLPWESYVSVPDVVLVQLDPEVTPIDFSLGAPLQVARGSVVTDSDGERQATLLFPDGGSMVNMELPDGAVLPALASLSVRGHRVHSGGQRTRGHARRTAEYNRLYLCS